jgi:hypothetical protein
MSRPARRTRGMEGIAERTRIKRSRKLQSVQEIKRARESNANESQTSEAKQKNEHEKKRIKIGSTKKEMRKMSCLPG